MFSDLVGSTALSIHMDPEDLREVISAYQKCVVETVQRFGGFVAKYMGDGVLIYFGYPQAHEDDAERAVRSGLELVAAVGALKTQSPLQTRVGIATGLVVVGDLIGSGASQEQAILLQDAAYGTLLRVRRQELHGRVVSVLQRDFPEFRANQPEVLAHHCSEGSMISEAIEYYLAASQRATAAFNTIEASAHLRRGMTLIEQLPSSEPRRAQLHYRLMMGGWWLI